MSYESFNSPQISVGRVLEFRQVERARDPKIFDVEIATLEAFLLGTVTDKLASDEAGAHELLMRSSLWRALRHGLEENDSLYTELGAVLSKEEVEILETAEHFIAEFPKNYKEKYPSVD